MNRGIYLLILFLSLLACRNFNKGVIEKKQLRGKKPPSVKIAEEYDKKSRKAAPKTYSNPKKAARMREKQAEKHKKKGERYLKRQQRQLKKNN